MQSASFDSGLPDPVAAPGYYAGVPFKRAMAWVIDMIFTVLVAFLFVPFTFFTAIFYFPLLVLFIGFIYRWFTISGQSSTWGMRLMAIELRDKDGLRLSHSTALAHTAGYTVSVAVYPLQLISAFMMLTASRGQGLTDNLLGTTAINRRL